MKISIPILALITAFIPNVQALPSAEDLKYYTDMYNTAMELIEQGKKVEAIDKWLSAPDSVAVKALEKIARMKQEGLSDKDIARNMCKSGTWATTLRSKAGALCKDPVVIGALGDYCQKDNYPNQEDFQGSQCFNVLPQSVKDSWNGAQKAQEKNVVEDDVDMEIGPSTVDIDIDMDIE